MPAFIQFEVFLDTDVFDAVEEQISKSGALGQNILKLVQQRSSKRLKRVFVEPQNLPALPFIWSYDPAANARARRYYFAVIVANNPSPTRRYQRTGELLKNLQVQILKDTQGDLLTVTSEAAGAPFVIGEQQVPSHSVTPWLRLDEVVIEESLRATDDAIELWYTLADPFAGVPQK